MTQIVVKTLKIHLFPLERHLYGHPPAGSLVVKAVRGSSNGTRMGKNTEWIMPVCLSKNQDYSYRYTWMDIKMAGKKQNMAPTWKKLTKRADLDEPTSFLDHVFLGCTPRDCKPNEISY